MRGAIPPLPQYAFMAWCLVKHMDNFTFYVILFIKNYTEVFYAVYEGMSHPFSVRRFLTGLRRWEK
jgi:hypothetical protein